MISDFDLGRIISQWSEDSYEGQALRELQSRREAERCHGTGKRTAEPAVFAPKRGACALSYDLWWCTNCKRGVGTDGPDTAHFKAGSWAFCPKCGVRLDWKAVGIERSDEGFPASEIIEEPQYRKPAADELLTALREIAGKICGSQCNDPERKPPLAGNARCARCIAVDAIAQYEQKERG